MQQFILIIHVLVSISLIGLVLIQHGKGADLGASLGSGASQTMFGSQGSGSFLIRVTSVLAALFFITSLSLGYLATHQATPNQSLLEAPSGLSTPASKSDSSRDVN